MMNYLDLKTVYFFKIKLRYGCKPPYHELFQVRPACSRKNLFKQRQLIKYKTTSAHHFSNPKMSS